MRFEKWRNTIDTAFIILASVAMAVITLIPGCKGKEGEKKQAPKTERKVIIQNGITSLPLKAALHQQQMPAYGMVLQPGPLIDIRNNYIAARASVDKATAALEASRKEYERLKKLNEENQNISLKAVQADRAVMSSDQAELSASNGKLQAIKQAATAQWGTVIAQWVFSSSPGFRKLVELEDVLIRITLPSDKFIAAAPETVNIQSPASRTVQAMLISRAPTTDSRIQGASYFYMAPSYAAGLTPGLNLQISLPVGPNIKGVVIPFSAIIWFQGKAWAYVQTDPEHFSRREVAVMDPVRDGYFVQEGFRPGEMAVIRGAQILLSRELLPSKPAGGEEED